MKSKEEFKQSIFQKRDRYFAKKRAARKRFISVAAPVAVFVIICGAIFTPRMMLWNNYNDKDNNSDGITVRESGTTAIDDSLNINAPVSVVITSIPLMEHDGGTKTSDDTDKIKALSDFFSSLVVSESAPEIDESSSGGYVVGITYADSSTLTVTFLKNGYVQINGAWTALTSKQSETLLQLICSVFSSQTT